MRLKKLYSIIENQRLLAKARKPGARIGSTAFSPFFILSAGRSGSTLLRRMLMVNSRIHIPPESDDIIPMAARRFLLSKDRGWHDQVEHVFALFEKSPCLDYWHLDLNSVKSKVHALEQSSRTYADIIDVLYRYHANSPASNHNLIWGDKTPYLIYLQDWLQVIFPNAKYIFLFRDGRAAVHSMVKSQGYTLERAATRWKDAVHLYKKWRRNIKPSNIMCVYYKDLVEKSEETLKAICGFIGVSFSKNMIDTLPESMGDTVLPHHRNVSTPLSNQFADKWKEGMTAEQIQFLNNYMRKELDYLGMKLNDQ